MANNTKNKSDFNLHTLNTKELQIHLKATIEFGGNVIIVGRRGGGKTAICRQTVAASKCRELYLNPSTFERTDLAGFPKLFNADKESRWVEYLLPKYFSSLIEGDVPVALILDEVDKIDFSVSAALLELVKEHSINGLVLPNLKAVLMTGNLPSEGGRRPPLFLLDRAEKYLLKADAKLFLDWGADIGNLHPAVAAYIGERQDDLVGELDPGDIYADQSPRGWDYISKITHYGEKHNWSAGLVLEKAAGCVGKAAAARYSSYFTHYRELLPIVEKVLLGEKIKDFDKILPSKKIITVMILCNRVARILDDLKKARKTELPSPVKAAGKFLATVDPELVLLGLRGGIGIERFAMLEISKDWSGMMDKLMEQLGVSDEV